MKIVVGFAVFFILNLVGNQIVGPTRCSDGWASPSIGKQGACSHHGGVNRSPKSGVLILSILGGFVAAAFVGSGEPRSQRQNLEGKNSSLRKRKDGQHGNGATPQCPVCGSDMVLRVAKKGKYAGRQFYGCKKYPRCKGLVNIERTPD